MTEKIKPILFYVFLFLFILTFCTMPTFFDVDLWARLIAGMGFIQTGHVLKQDFLSYTPTHTWFDHEWGSGVVFYLTQHFFTSAGLIVLQAVLTFLIFVLVIKTVKLRGVKTTTPYNFIFYYFAFMAISYITNNPVRCQMFSFVFFALFLYILELIRKDEPHGKWALNGDIGALVYPTILMIIWNNLHGGCVSGIGLIALYIIGEALNRKPIKKYIYMLILTTLVLPINPWGFSYIPFLLSATTMPRPDVIEWWGLFSKFHMHGYGVFRVFTLIMLFAESGIIISQLIKKTFVFDKTKFIVIAATLFLAIQHVKMVPFAVISMICFLYDDYFTAFNSITKNFFNKPIVANIKEFIVYGVMVIFIASNLNAKSFETKLGWDAYPILATEFIKINNLKGNLLIDFGLGSYASYKLYPNNKIFMDGRYEEVYYDYMLPLLNKFYLLKPGWDEVLKKFPPDIMIIERKYPVFAAINYRKDWKLIFVDGKFGVFAKSAEMAKRHHKPFIAPSKDIEYYKKTLFDTNINFMLQSKNGKQ